MKKKPTLKEIEKYLYDIFYKKRPKARNLYSGQTIVKINHWYDEVQWNLAFTIITEGGPIITTGKGGFEQYLEFGGLYDALYYNGVPVPLDKTQALYDKFGINPDKVKMQRFNEEMLDIENQLMFGKDYKDKKL